MAAVEDWLNVLGARLARLLDPVAGWLDELGFAARHQLGQLGVPAAWHSAILTAAWVIALFLVFRVLAVWLRLVLVVLVAMVAARVFGFLPNG